MRGFGEQSLVNVTATNLEAMRRSRHIQSPDAIRNIAGQTSRLALVLFQAAHPVAQREHIMLAQAFHVPHLFHLPPSPFEKMSCNKDSVIKSARSVVRNGVVISCRYHSRNPRI